ncbi:MAG TPA: ABC transporter permease [Planctomycetaceae bacterium]|nr:ABC transporter permease [Planctomycetaceae bacterium]
MSLWKIAWRSIQQRALASVLTAFAMGLGVALVVSVLVIHGVVDQSFRRGAQGYDLIVGAKGESIQLVLNTVFHLGMAPENIPYSYYDELIEGRFSRAVETAIPVAMGHAYKTYPVIATVPDMFDRLKYMGDREYEFAEGRNFDVNQPFEAVIGSTVARKLKMKVGDTFRPTHPGEDITGDAEDESHEPITIVGILAHTGTPNDRAIFMNLEGFYHFDCHQGGPGTVRQYLKGKAGDSNTTKSDSAESHAKSEESKSDAAPGLPGIDAADDHDHESPPAKLDSHEHDDAEHDHAKSPDALAELSHDARDNPHGTHHHGPTPLADRKLSAVLVCTDSDNQALGMQLRSIINEENDAQAVAPTEIISQLFDGIIGNIQLILVILAVLVVVVAGIGILVSIYNSMSDRRHEIAVMRALGASRMMVGTIILLESILLSLGGGLFGLLLGHGLVGLLAPTIAEHTGVIVSAFQFQWNELILIPGLITLASLVGYVPAAVAYRTDVAKSLAANQ